MDPFHHPSGGSITCKWCSFKPSEVMFENAKLCLTCHDKALLAVQNPRLCEECNAIFTEENVTRSLFSEYGYSHLSRNALESSAERGCGLCRMFLLQDPNPDERRLQMSLSLFAEGSLSDDGCTVDINSLYFSSEPDMFKLKLSVAALDDNAKMITSQSPIEKDLGDDNTIVQAQNWLSECLTKHSESTSLKDDLPGNRKPFPTRVIDVGTNSSSVAKLFQPSDTIYDDYVTLSYCWGRTRFLTTLKSNLEEHFRGLEEAKLPQTFVDAIKTTRKLGFRYIWIDALCIIQDSIEDKIIEIGNMENIYSNSTLTIAVVNAPSVMEGFLKTKPRLSVDVPCRSPNGGPGTIKISPQVEVDMWQQPLYTRAWCLQENLLSARMLLFTNTEVLWQCRSHPILRPSTTHVEYLYENPNLASSPFGRIPDSVTVEKSQSSVSPELEYERYKAWHHTVQNYTKRNLTVLSDRFPAISGVAQKFKDAWENEYFAGVWKPHFLASLTWRRTSSWQGPADKYWPPLKEYRAPSWSWASIEGPIEFDWRLDLGNMRGLGAKLISCEVVPLRNQASLGEVKSGRAVLEASLIPGRDLPNRGIAGLDAETYRIGGTLVLDNHEEDRWPGPGRAHLLSQGEGLMENSVGMLLGEGRDGGGKMTSTTVLVLMPVEGEVDTFRRVGFWSTSHKGTSKMWVGAGKRKTFTII
ncbi:HET-domain-containing protein [Mollisia scopiformis]|uniref:HET-domain-containing protein n=1 Tax=Mollisia scopiformis TaxID=149040 RepID=A0A194X2I8_MOLSC|nr:HET-domain-containing protein [Mollisia scopiformis]KUJ14052.1 HET-domain-containing protein [Mollisia scopiformis]